MVSALTHLGPDKGGHLAVGAVRRHQIIMVVRRLVASDGVGSVTIARIADRMGTSRGVVNYHFKNKGQILRAALQSAARDASAATDQIVAESQDVSSVVDLVVGLADSGSDWWQVYVAFLAEATHDDFAREMIRDTDRSFRLHLSRVLGDNARGAVLLALMKGLALQRIVDATFDTDGALQETQALSSEWSSQLLRE